MQVSEVMNYVAVVSAEAQTISDQSFSRAVGDLLKIESGGAAELYTLMLRGVKSTRHTHWLEQIRDPDSRRDLEIWAFCLDNAGDNQLVTKQICEDTKRAQWLCVITCWCWFHQYHLLCKAALEYTDRQWLGRWSGSSYFTTMSGMANIWRSVNIPKNQTSCNFRVRGNNGKQIM